jgi:Cu(I)/Ag(I) efflux system membrane fusion protein
MTLGWLVVVGVVLVGAVTLRASDPTPMLDAYFRVHAALSDDRVDGVQTDAAAIATAAKGLGEAGAPIAQAADALAGAADLASARKAFGPLSDALVAYAEATKTAGEGVHAMFCPMANKQWLQKDEKVRNPYFGKAMLTCGEKKTKG